MNRTVIFDSETSGLPVNGGELAVQPRIIELGAVFVENGEIVGKYSQLIRPGFDITAEITKITGITNEDLVHKPNFTEAWNGVSGEQVNGNPWNEPVESFRDMLKQCATLIAHNAPFDTLMLTFELQRMSLDPKEFIPETVLCTVSEFRHLFGRRAKLTELYEKMTGQPLAQTHRALDDAMALYECCKKGGLI